MGLTAPSVAFNGNSTSVVLFILAFHFYQKLEKKGMQTEGWWEVGVFLKGWVGGGAV